MPRRRIGDGERLPWEGAGAAPQGEQAAPGSPPADRAGYPSPPDPRGPEGVQERPRSPVRIEDVASARGLVAGELPGVDLRTMKRAVARMVARIQAAREDVDSFIEFVLRGEEHHERVRQAPHHRDLQAALEESRHFVGFYPVEHGKSFQLLGRVLFEVGRNPSVRIAYISGSVKQAKKLAKAVREYVEESPEYRAVFPDVRPSTRFGAPWTQTQLEVERPIGIKDPTLECFGVGSGAITGARLEVIILDDILDGENTRTPEQRKKVLDWIDSSSVEGRLGPGGRLWVLGTPWHQDDAMHHLEARADVWRSMRRPAVSNPSDPPEQWRVLWPKRWPIARLVDKRKTLTPDEWARQMLVVARDDKTSRFKRVWFDRAYLRGQGQAMPFRYRGPLVTVAGVDLAVGKNEENAETSIVTLAVHPNGDRQLLFVESGRWSAREIMVKVTGTWRRYDCQLIYVEDVAAQAYLVELLAESSPVPVEGWTTSGRKNDPVYGFEQMAVELNNGKWILPSDAATGRQPLNEEERKLVEEVLWYSPSEHTGDRAMACYFAREAAKAVGGMPVEAPNLNR